MIKISLKAARVNADLTLTEAAKLIGIGQRTLWAWENGKTEPKLSQVEIMSQVYKMPAEYFFIPSVQSN